MSGAAKGCVENGRRASREQPNGVSGTGNGAVRVEHVEGVSRERQGACRTVRFRVTCVLDCRPNFRIQV